jgi:hypothetical protein
MAQDLRARLLWGAGLFILSQSSYRTLTKVLPTTGGGWFPLVIRREGIAEVVATVLDDPGGAELRSAD